MAKKGASATPPTEASPDGESNPYLAKFKASLCKRWSFTKMETLYEIFDLAAFLWALERKDEPLAVAGSVTTGMPGPPPLPRGGFNYNLWCPATFSHALLVHLTPDRAETSRAAILANPGVSRDNPKYIADGVADARSAAAAPPAQESIKSECQRLARHLGTLVLYSELAKAGDPVFSPHLNDAVSLIPQLLSKLQARLSTAK
jgi:hypothetical protein